MSFVIKIKLGNVTNLSDARYAAAVGIHYIGFCFDPSDENYLAPIRAKEMIDWISGSNIVAEFGDQPLSEIRDISELLHIDVIEVNNHLLPDELQGLQKAVIKKIDISAFSLPQLETELQAYRSVCDAFHLYTSGKGADPETLGRIAGLFANEKLIWGFELDPGNIGEVISTYKPYALNLSGGSEEKAGVRDFDSLNELIELLSEEE